MDIKTASEWLDAIKHKYIHGGDESYDEQRKEAIDFAIKTMNDQQNQIWELQDLNEHLEDRQKKIRMFVDSKGEIHPLEPEPVEPKEETNSNNLHGSFWTCGKCGQAMTVSKGFVRYCWNCGTPVKWD